MLAATAAALALAGGVRAAATQRAPQPAPYCVLCAGLAAMGAAHAHFVHAAAGAAPGVAAGALCFVAAAVAATELTLAHNA